MVKLTRLSLSYCPLPLLCGAIYFSGLSVTPADCCLSALKVPNHQSYKREKLSQHIQCFLSPETLGNRRVSHAARFLPPRRTSATNAHALLLVSVELGLVTASPPLCYVIEVLRHKFAWGAGGYGGYCKVGEDIVRLYQDNFVKSMGGAGHIDQTP
ncbi:hypothetical protein EDC04DRAFT_2673870 [Pisolithus marmoratus]|nr:hypothetical protein EDC04DRAFT_2673870 [Pisolithus marmoratus]